MNDSETNTALLKLALVWIGTMVGGVTLSGIVLTLTGLFTALQIFILVRDKLWRKP